MIHIYDSSTLPVSRWRNGGGETREIVSYPPGVADFDWRISIATIAAEGDFSLFPGIDRIITLLSGEVTLYRHHQQFQALTLHQPFSFAGEEPVSARLSAQTSTDFNIMARRSLCLPDAGVTTRAFSPATTLAGVVYVLSGQWQHQQTLLTAAQGAWWENNAGTFNPLTPDARLLWGTLKTREPAV